MTSEHQSCTLCKKAPRRKPGLLLCQDCADPVSRVMACEIYEANHYRDRPGATCASEIVCESGKNFEVTTMVSNELMAARPVERAAESANIAQSPSPKSPVHGSAPGGPGIEPRWTRGKFTGPSWAIHTRTACSFTLELRRLRTRALV